MVNEEKLLPGLRAHHGNRVQDDVWYLDNGASNHMIGDRTHELDEKIRGHVRFGDGSSVEIRGKGLAEVQNRRSCFPTSISFRICATSASGSWWRKDVEWCWMVFLGSLTGPLDEGEADSEPIIQDRVGDLQAGLFCCKS